MESGPPVSPTATSLAEADLAPILTRYREDGFARVGRVFAEATLARLRERAEAIMLGQVAYPGLFFQHDTTTGRYEDLEYKKGYVGPSLHYRKVEKLERDPLFWELVNHPLFERIARLTESSGLKHVSQQCPAAALLQSPMGTQRLPELIGTDGHKLDCRTGCIAGNGDGPF